MSVSEVSRPQPHLVRAFELEFDRIASLPCSIEVKIRTLVLLRHVWIERAPGEKFDFDAPFHFRSEVATRATIAAEIEAFGSEIEQRIAELLAAKGRAA